MKPPYQDVRSPPRPKPAGTPAPYQQPFTPQQQPSPPQYGMYQQPASPVQQPMSPQQPYHHFQPNFPAAPTNPASPKQPVRAMNAFMQGKMADNALKGAAAAADFFAEGSPIPGTEVVFKLAGEIARMVSQARENKKQVGSLSQRVHTICPLIEQVKRTRSNLTLFNAVNQTVTCLENCKAQILKFTQKNFFIKVISAGADQEKFLELNREVTEAIHALQLGLSIKITQTVEQINAQVMVQHTQDVALDKQAILNNMTELLRLEKTHLEETRAMRAQVDGLSMKVEDTKSTIALQLDAVQMNLMDKLTANNKESQTAILSKLDELNKAFNNMQFSQHIPAPAMASSSEARELDKNEAVFKHLQIDMNDVRFDSIINKGSFGTIYMGEWLLKRVAIKVIGKRLQSTDYQQFVREVNIMANLRHENITQIFAASKEPQACIVMEYMSNGSLDQYLQGHKLSIDEQLAIGLNITLGLLYMHKQGAVHRDLKTANVLINEHKVAKLTDFGLSKKFGSVGQKSIGVTSDDIHWMAPEVLGGRLGESFQAHSDIYSFGTVLWSLFTGRKPFSQWPLNTNAEMSQFTSAVTQLGLTEDIPAEVPPPVQSIITRCWNRATNARPELSEVGETLRNFDTIPEDTAEKLCEQGAILEQQKDFKQAYRYYLKSARKGYFRAQTNVATFLLNGIGCEQNKSAAAGWFEKSANPSPEEKRAPHNRAAYNLARMYDLGDGVDRDIQKATRYYEVAANGGFPGAAERLQQIRNVNQSFAPGMR